MDLLPVHSELDESVRADLEREGTACVLAGSTEWRGKLQLEVTIGWDWYLDLDGDIFLAFGDVRSNVMGITEAGRDVGMAETVRMLNRKLTTIDWACQVRRDLCLGPQERS